MALRSFDKTSQLPGGSVSFGAPSDFKDQPRIGASRLQRRPRHVARSYGGQTIVGQGWLQQVMQIGGSPGQQIFLQAASALDIGITLAAAAAARARIR